MTWRTFDRVIPVIAHPRERSGGIGLVVDKPEAGIRWGKPARATYSTTDPIDPARDGGFNTIEVPDHKHVVKVHNLTPVYAEYDVLKVEHAERPEETIEIRHTTSVIIPLGKVKEKRISGATFGGASVKVQYEDVDISRYLELSFNVDRPKRSKWISSGTWGEYPDLPEEPPHG